MRLLHGDCLEVMPTLDENSVDTLLTDPTGGVVLDPFMGSGTTGIACVNEGRDFIGIEQNEEYLEIARRRIEHAQSELKADLPLLELIDND